LPLVRKIAFNINSNSNLPEISRAMPTEQPLLRLPEDLMRRFRRAVPSRERSLSVQQLLEQALQAADDDDDPLYRAALDVERQAGLNAEMGEWEAATLEDGLESEGPASRP
jgi:hypothetical protein